MRPAFRLPTPVLLGLPLVGLGLVLGNFSAVWKAAIFNVMSLLVLGFGALEAWQRAVREPTWARFWKPYAAMLWVIALLQGGMLVRLLSSGVALPRPPLAWLLAWGVFTLLGVALMVARVIPPGSRSAGLRPTLDATIFAVTFFLVLWILGLRDIRNVPLDHLEQGGLSLLFIGLAGTLGLSAHALWEDRSLLLGPFGLFQVLLILLCAMQARIILLFMQGGFSQDHPVRISLGLLGLALAALVPRVPWRDADRKESWGWMEDLLPNLPALGALVAYGFDFATRGAGEVVATLLLLLAFLLILARQASTFLDLRTLHESLGTRVEEQTRDLAQSQDLLLRTQRMNLVAILGAGLAHDVNNFIGASLLYSQLLEEEGPVLESGPSKDLARLRGALVKAGDLTRRLMGFAEEAEGEAGILDLNRHVEAEGPLLRTLVPKDLQLDLQTTTEALPIRAKPTFLDQVLVNLVSNARDATARGGKITVRLAREDRRAVLEVSDTGCGMPPEVQAHIFEPFFTTKPPGRGTGLGLSAVGRLVEELGGTLELHSEVGVGTTFRICFHLEAAPEGP